MDHDFKIQQQLFEASEENKPKLQNVYIHTFRNKIKAKLTEMKLKEQRNFERENKGEVDIEGCLTKLHNSTFRSWMQKSGRAHLLEFTDQELQKLLECFNTLDTDGGKTISIDELEKPLIGLGFVDTTEEVA